MPGARVRRLRLDDHADTMRLAAEFHAQTVYRDYPLSLAKVDRLFEQSLLSPDHRAVVAADTATDRMQGYLLGVCFEHYFSNTSTVSDLGFYVSPAWRSPQLARAMLRDLEAWAWERGARDISLGITAGIADPQVVRLYERLGYARGSYMVVKTSR